MTDNEKRRLDLSGKFIQMGQALLKEGSENDDYIIERSGSFLIMIAGLIYDEDDVSLFSELCAMFSAKKILDKMDEDGELEEIRSKTKKQTYDDIISKINKIKDENEDIDDDDENEDDNL